MKKGNSGIDRILACFACSCLGVLCAFTDVRATDYFVSAQAGDDANIGLSESAPWRTTAKVQAEAREGRLLPGDRILFRRGDRWSPDTTGAIPQLYIDEITSGTIDAPITFGAYGSGEPPLIDFGPVAEQEANGTLVTFGWRFDGTDSIRLENLRFTGGFNTFEFLGSSRVIDFVGRTDNIVVADVRISDSAIGAALDVAGVSSTERSDNVVIQRVSLVNTFPERYRRDGIYVQYVSNVTVEDCIIERAGTVGMLIGGVRYALVRRNSISSGLAWAIAAGYGGRYVTVEWNKIIGNGDDAFTRPPFQSTGEGLCDPDTFNPMAIDLTLVSNWDIRYNLVGKQHKPCRNRWETNFVYLEGYCGNIRIYGNVAYQIDGPCFVSGDCADNYFVNNLCYDDNLAYSDPNHEQADIRLAGGWCDDVQLDENTALCQGWTSCPCPQIELIGGEYRFEVNGVHYPASRLQGTVHVNTVVANNIVVNKSIPASATDTSIMAIGLIGSYSDKTTRAVIRNNMSWAPPGKMYGFGVFSGGSYTPMSFDEWNGWSRTDPDTGATITVANEMNLDPQVPFDDGDGVDQSDFVPPKGSPAYDRPEGTYTDTVVGAGDMAMLLDAAGIEFDEGKGFVAMVLANNWDGSHATSDLGPFVGTNDPAPVITDGPDLSLDENVPLSSDPEIPSVTGGLDPIFWAYADEKVACTTAATHTYQYRRPGDASWSAGTPDSYLWWVWIETPGRIMGVGPFEFRVIITDCAGNATTSGLYYLNVVPTDDGDADGVPDLLDCAPGDPSAFAAPGEVSGVSFLADRVTLEWDSQASNAGPGTMYDVLRGALDGLPVGSSGSETCLEPRSADTLTVDREEPAPGTGFYYLVRGVNVCGAGTYGLDSGATERVSIACP